jgi:hypothetical protein
MAHPKVNDPIFQKGKGFVRYVVVGVDAEKRTADVKTVSGDIILTRGVPWEAISYLDESQTALQIIREANERE